MKRIASMAACMVLALGSTSARADWQYTRWGMTSAQVVAASRGAAVASKGIPGDRVDGQEVEATGTYSTGEFKFQSVFYFVDNKLADIRLKLIDSNPYPLKNALDGPYGKPFYESDGAFFIVTYHDGKKNNRVDLLAIGDSTTLEYRPLIDASASGL